MNAATIAALAGIAVALIGVWAELVRNRRAVGSNGGSSLHDIVARIDDKVDDHGERISAVEARLDERRNVTVTKRG